MVAGQLAEADLSMLLNVSQKLLDGPNPDEGPCCEHCVRKLAEGRALPSPPR
jgi:hypothetical protein